MFESAVDFRDYIQEKHPDLVQSTCDRGVHLKWSDRSVEVWDATEKEILADLELVENHKIALQGIQITDELDEENVETDNQMIEFVTITGDKITTSFA
jgi:hypothetical protein